MNTQEKEKTQKETLYCVLEKNQNPFGCRISATSKIEYLWLYYYEGFKEKYRVYRVTDYREYPIPISVSGFTFIEALALEVYDEVFDEYAEKYNVDKSHPKEYIIGMERR